MPRSVSFYTLGCKLNFSETSTLARQLKEGGMQVKDFRDGADVYVINTCSVTDHADRKCRKVVNEALRYNPKAFVVVVVLVGLVGLVGLGRWSYPLSYCGVTSLHA